VSTAAQLIGTRLDAYEIQALLGSGGMANVYRAFDTNLQRMVAIKVLSPAAAAQPGFVDRFRQEARLIANLRHPHIVHVYDFGQHENAIYMVQELLAGPTLETWMRDMAARGTRPAPQAIIEILTQLASALDAAHAAGVIHRDVKPGNALWNDQGRLVLTDFGIAKQVISATSQTQVGLILGTPSYLSPEQAQGLPLTPASDVYSLGVVLYELLVGDVPFRGTTPMQVVMDHIQRPLPPLPPRPDISRDLEAVVRRALAKDPAARFNSAGELASALASTWAELPARPSAKTDIHNEATRVWQQPTPAEVPPSSSVPAAPLARPQIAPRHASPAAPIRQAQPLPTSSRLRLGVLGALLATLLLVGLVLAARGTTRTADTIGSSVTSAPIATPNNPIPSPSTDSFTQFRAVIETGRAAGHTGTRGDELLAALDNAQQALAAGETTTAVQHFSTFQQMLLAGTGDGTIDAGFMVEAMKRVQSLAKSHGLTLPFSMQLDEDTP
jgi:eukaryotic-like serine/threonine-protein kinase